MMCVRPVILLATVCLALAITTRQAECQAQQATPSVRIAYFGGMKAQETGKEPIVLTAVIQNGTDDPNTSREYAVRLTLVSGLEFIGGEPIISMNDVIKGGTQSFKWTVEPRSMMTPLIASIALEKNGRPVDLKVVTLQTGPFAPPPFNKQIPARPVASAHDLTGYLENDRIHVQLHFSSAATPSLSIYARYAEGWRKAGIISPVATITSAEPGQSPWEETFRVEAVRSNSTADSATLALSGGIGLRWRGTVTLTLKKASGVIEQQVSIAPLRPMRVFRLSCLQVLGGSGGFGNQVSEPVMEINSDAFAGTVIRNGDMTIASLGAKVQAFGTSGNLTAVQTYRPEQVAFVPLTPAYVSDIEPIQVVPGAILTILSRTAILFPSKSTSDVEKLLVTSVKH